MRSGHKDVTDLNGGPAAPPDPPPAPEGGEPGAVQTLWQGAPGAGTVTLTRDGAPLATAPTRTGTGLALTFIPALTPTIENVRDYGAKGDGATDDRAAIQATLDAALAGQTVAFPAGIYRLGGEIRVTKSGLTLAGDGPASILSHAGQTGLNITGAFSGLKITRLGFRGLPGKYMADGNRGYAIYQYGPTGTQIIDCAFTGSGVAVMNSGGPVKTPGTVIAGCRLNGWGTTGFYLNGGERITNCQLVQDDPDRLGERSSHGLYIPVGSTDITIADTLIQNARKYGAQVWLNQAGLPIAGIRFQRVTFQDCARALIVARGGVSWGSVADVLVDACTVKGTYAGQAIIVWTGDRVRITNNVIDGAALSGVQVGGWPSGTTGEQIANMVVSNNRVTNCRDRGILFAGAAGNGFANCLVSGNQVSLCGRLIDLINVTGGVTVVGW